MNVYYSTRDCSTGTESFGTHVNTVWIFGIAEDFLLALQTLSEPPFVLTLSLSAATTRRLACVQACVHGDVFSSGVIVCVLSNSVTWGYRGAWRALAERTSGRPAIHPVLLPLAVLSLTVIASNKVQQLYILTLEDAANLGGSLHPICDRDYDLARGVSRSIGKFNSILWDVS